MARYKLIEYLNNPSLLKSTSIEELQLWAEEAPYAGIIRKLIAQKMAIENISSPESEKANTLAILSSANPNYTLSSIEDFKTMILQNGSTSSEEESGLNEEPILDEVESTSHEGKEIAEQHPSTPQEGEITEEIVELFIPEKEEPQQEHEEERDPLVDISKLESALQLDEAVEVEDSEDEFYSWLSTLKSVDTLSDESSTSLELGDRELASEGLAELLITQGHYQKAIEMYRALQLKNPQKSSFFAAQIEKLKAL